MTIESQIKDQIKKINAEISVRRNNRLVDHDFDHMVWLEAERDELEDKRDQLKVEQ
jgi:hypothetical protein